MPATRALGSISKNWLMLVPVLLCAFAAAPVPARKEAQARSKKMGFVLIIQLLASFNDCKLANVRAQAASIHVKNVQSWRHIEIILRAQIPRHHAGIGAVVMQCLHQLAAHREDADGAVQRQVAKLHATFAAARDGKALRL